MTKPDYLSASFVIGVSLLGTTCLVLVILILVGIVPWTEAVQPFGGIAAAAIGLISAVYTVYLVHREKVKHDRRSLAKALAGEVTAIRTWIFNSCDNPPNWNALSQNQLAWSHAVESLRPPPLTIYGPEIYSALGSLDHPAVFAFAEFRGHLETLSRLIDSCAKLDPQDGLTSIPALMRLLETVGRQADDVATSLAANFNVNLSFVAAWP